MDQRYAISVIIPTCDRADLLLEAIDSVINQSVQPLEIIVVNNGHGETLTGNTSPLIKVLRLEPYIGVSRARNAGAQAASGRYLAFLDDDDRWAPDYLSHASRIIERDRPDVILATLDWVANGQVIESRCLPAQYSEGDLLLGCYVSGSNTLVGKEAFMRSVGYDTDLAWGEDATLIVDMYFRGAHITPSRDMHTLYCQHDGARLTGKVASDKFSRYIAKNADKIGTKYRMYCKMRLYREKARETHSFKYYLISKLYRSAFKLISVFNNQRRPS